MEKIVNTFRVTSGYMEDVFENVADAKALALAESAKFDDPVYIERDGLYVYMARFGSLYRLSRVAAS
jgi:hypothetical protein